MERHLVTPVDPGDRFLAKPKGEECQRFPDEADGSHRQ